MIKETDRFPAHIQDLIKHFNFDRLPVEGTFYNSTYRSTETNADGKPCGTAMIGMYCEQPLSVSCFHRLQSDEVWHFYAGDSFYLYLLYPDGTHEKVLLGNDILNGQNIQYVVPAGVWQAGALASGGKYALFGCTMAPGFTGTGFEAAIGEELETQYPDLKDIIKKLSVNGHQTKMPAGFSE